MFRQVIGCSLWVLGIGLVLNSCSDDFSAPEAGYPIKTVPHTAVHLEDNFWSTRLQTLSDVTLPHIMHHYDSTGIIDNFAIAAGTMQGTQGGIYPFEDSDVYKTVEGLSRLIAAGDTQWEALTDSLINLFGAAMEDDGYLYTARTNKAEWLERRSGKQRWSNLHYGHELYNSGHLYEAAAAHYRATGKRTLLDIALKNASLVLREFGPGKIEAPPGHQEIELGLVKLYEITGEQKYLDLAKFFLEQRGVSHQSRKLWGEYAQDQIPVRQQTEAVGHAVRLAYMGAALTDVGVKGHDQSLVEASLRLWQNVVAKKLYITGGLGSIGIGEGFAGNYDLPNLSAYQETCASIGNVIWNQRLFLQSGDARFIDVLERSLYNSLLSGYGLSGKAFFYPNVLASRGYDERSKWFACNCCISNLSRFIPDIGSYFYALSNDTLFANLYAAGTASFALKNQTVRLTQATGYPWDGKIRLTVNTDREKKFEVRLRVPGWARERPLPTQLYRFHQADSSQVTLSVNDQPVGLVLNKGYAVINRQWRDGDQIELHLPMPVRRILAGDSVAQNRGMVALQRGPLVYCLEGVDNPGGRVLDLLLTDNTTFKVDYHQQLPGGINLLASQPAYTSDSISIHNQRSQITAIPYFAWAHRGRAEMTVWILREPTIATPLFQPLLATNGRISSSGGNVASALNDGFLPRSSDDGSRGYFSFQPVNDTLWVQYDFKDPQEISAVDVYWFSDTAANGHRPPASWRILTWQDDQWQRAYTPSKTWGVAEDRFNSQVFETFRTQSVRLEVIPQAGFKAGILEWKVD